MPTYYRAIICQTLPSLERNSRPSPAFRQRYSIQNEQVLQNLWNCYVEWRKARQLDDFSQFEADRQARNKKAAADMEALPDFLPNAKKGQAYSCSVSIPQSVRFYSIKGLEAAGLSGARGAGENRNEILISGVPQAAGEFEMEVAYSGSGYLGDRRLKTWKLRVNPDPRELWRDIPADKAMEYYKPETAGAEMEGACARLLAASRRGRSHAHAGSARDDDFAIGAENGWNVLIVADGAGSAGFSREGSRLACESALRFCLEKAAAGGRLDEFFRQNAGLFARDADLLATARKTVYDVLPGAAFEAHSRIVKEAKARERAAKMYATTLLMLMAKLYPEGWVILSWQVGDGAMALLSDGPAGLEATLLAEPDEGEFGGQTRFITMREMFEPNELMRRIRVDFAPRFSAAVLMTDGISDAWFATLANLRNPESWREFRKALAPALQSPASVEALLEWLNFWSQGNHDDRTLALLLPQAGGCA